MERAPLELAGMLAAPACAARRRPLQIMVTPLLSSADK
jgi:hypothetical protein